MNIRQAIKSNMTAADFIVNGYLADLTPEEMLAREIFMKRDLTA